MKEHAWAFFFSRLCSSKDRNQNILTQHLRVNELKIYNLVHDIFNDYNIDWYDNIKQGKREYDLQSVKNVPELLHYATEEKGED